MARIAFVDHSYHRKTRATLFLQEILKSRGHRVDVFWDEAWAEGEPVVWESVATHDVVIMFQSYCPAEGRIFSSMHPNVLYVPMFDQFGFSAGVFERMSTFWEPFRGSKVLSFSTAVHTLASAFGMMSLLVHYYPEPAQVRPRTAQGLHGFFWLRREKELGWDVIRRLIGSTVFKSLHVHLVGDPGFPPVEPPSQKDTQAYNISLSTWFEKRSDLEKIVRKANVYFAPRLKEGIGQAFLEAMARGQCVVAPDNPTMNEYIVHGVNGLLYDPGAPTPLDFSDVTHLGDAARCGVSAGRMRWRSAEETLVDFILTPSADLHGESIERRPTEVKSVGRLGPSRLTQAARSVSHTVSAAVRRRADG
jgi:glycosyl transferase family 1